MLPEITPAEFATALEAVALEVLACAGIEHPPIDAIKVAGALGLVIAWDASQTGRARLVKSRHLARGSEGAILLRPEPRVERRQWAVAHEVGEKAANRVFARLCVEPGEAPSDAREKVANLLAARLLLPGAWFGPDAEAADWDLVELKSRYATASHELIARRMLDFSPRAIISIFDHGKMTFRRTSESGPTFPISPAESRCQDAAHRTGQRQDIHDRVRIQAWPVHEPDWKREILRTSFEGWSEQ